MQFGRSNQLNLERRLPDRNLVEGQVAIRSSKFRWHRYFGTDGTDGTDSALNLTLKRLQWSMSVEKKNPNRSLWPNDTTV